GIARALSEPEPGRRPLTASVLMADVREGLRFLIGHANVRTMTLVGATQSVAGGAFVGQLVVWADRSLNVRAGNFRLGVLCALWGVGALAASVGMPKMVKRLGAPRVVLMGLPVSAVLATAPAPPRGWVLGGALLLGWRPAVLR